MRTNHIKEKLRQGEVSLGGWLSMASLSTARLMARLGFDWLVVDAEHSAQSPALMADMVATIADSGACAPFVRVPATTVEWFKWALDAGAWGVVVPMVNTPEQAVQAVSWCKYPPEGTRSIGGVFAPLGYCTLNRAEYAASINHEVMVIAQIESVEALANLDTILSVPGLDVAFVGPSDLHASLGLPVSSEGEEPEFMEALQKIRLAAARNNLPLGMFSKDGLAAARRVQQGFQMISVITDAGCLAEAAAQNLRLARG